jgi:hypothetical protein
MKVGLSIVRGFSFYKASVLLRVVYSLLIEGRSFLGLIFKERVVEWS